MNVMISLEKNINQFLRNVKWRGKKISIIPGSLNNRHWSTTALIASQGKKYFIKIPKTNVNDCFGKNPGNRDQIISLALGESWSLKWAREQIISENIMDVEVIVPLDLIPEIGALIFPLIESPLLWREMRKLPSKDYIPNLKRLGQVVGVLHYGLLQSKSMDLLSSLKPGLTLGDFEIRDVFINESKLSMFDINCTQNGNDQTLDIGRILYSLLNIWWPKLRYLAIPRLAMENWVTAFLEGYLKKAPQQAEEKLFNKLRLAAETSRERLRERFTEATPIFTKSLGRYISKIYIAPAFGLFEGILDDLEEKRTVKQ